MVIIIRYTNQHSKALAVNRIFYWCYISNWNDTMKWIIWIRLLLSLSLSLGSCSKSAARHEEHRATISSYNLSWFSRIGPKTLMFSTLLNAMLRNYIVFHCHRVFTHNFPFINKIYVRIPEYLTVKATARSKLNWRGECARWTVRRKIS